MVIPTYNRSDLLVRAVHSVIAQTYEPTEIIVVDDHSPIPAVDTIAASDIDRCNLTVIRHPSNRYVAAARNTGIAEATGDWVAFLDDDDEWHPAKLDRQVSAVTSAGADAVYTGIEQREDGRLLARKDPITRATINDLFHRNVIGTPSTIVARRTLLEEINGFDETLPSWQDWDLYLRVAERGKIIGIPGALTIQHAHDGHQMSDSYRERVTVTAPMMRHKHGKRSRRHGHQHVFEAALEAELGWSALNAGEIDHARHHFRSSLSHQHTVERMIMTIMTLGGQRCYELARAIKAALPGGYKFKATRPR